MEYLTQLETLAAVKVTVPKGHPLYIEGHPIRFGPYPNCLTNREVMVEALRELGEQERKYRSAVARGAAGIGLGKDEHAVNAYRQHLIDLLQEILYDGDEDAEESGHALAKLDFMAHQTPAALEELDELACPSSRHELEEEEVPAQEEIPVGTIVWGFIADTMLYRLQVCKALDREGEQLCEVISRVCIDPSLQANESIEQVYFRPDQLFTNPGKACEKALYVLSDLVTETQRRLLPLKEHEETIRQFFGRTGGDPEYAKGGITTREPFAESPTLDRFIEKLTGASKLKQLAEKVRHMRDVQVRYFAATAEDRAAAKMEGKHWMWKPKGSLAPELLKLSKQLEGEVDILLSEISTGGGNG